MCTNEPEFLEVLYAAQRTGLRLTPINWHLTGEEAAYIVENCEAKAFVCSGTLGDKVAVAAAAGGPGPGQDQHRGLHPRLRDVQRRGRRRGRRPTSTTRSSAPRCSTRRAPPGGPRACTATTAAVSALAAVNFCGYDEDYEATVDAHLLTGPLYHAAPLAFSVAVPFALRRARSWSWTTGSPWRRCADSSATAITHTHMVPTMFHRLLALPPRHGSASTPRRCASSSMARRRAPFPSSSA